MIWTEKQFSNFCPRASQVIQMIANKIYYCFRDILEPSGLGWVSPVHANNHGSHTLQPGDVTKIFEKVARQDIITLLKKYKMDFKVCGYEDTLQELISLTE